jgi:hypothetical protein
MADLLRLLAFLGLRVLPSNIFSDIDNEFGDDSIRVECRQAVQAVSEAIRSKLARL